MLRSPVARDLASAVQFDGQGDHHSPRPFVRQAFEKYLECGIFAHGVTRTRCGDCAHDFLVAYMAALHSGAIAFIHRFGSSLNEHVHFHVCAIDGVFEAVAGEEVDADADHQARAPGIIYHPGTGVNAQAVTQAQATLRLPLLRAFVGRGLLEGFEAKEMLGYKHSGYSVDTSVCIAAQDRAGLERLLRYCARPPFAMERLRKADSATVGEQWQQRFCQRCGAGLRLAKPKTGHTEKSRATGPEQALRQAQFGGR